MEGGRKEGGDEGRRGGKEEEGGKKEEGEGKMSTSLMTFGWERVMRI